MQFDEQIQQTDQNIGSSNRKSDANDSNDASLQMIPANALQFSSKFEVLIWDLQ